MSEKVVAGNISKTGERSERGFINNPDDLILLVFIVGMIYTGLFAGISGTSKTVDQIITHTRHFVMLLLWFYPILAVILSIMIFKECIKVKIKFDVRSNPLNKFIFIVFTFISMNIFFIGFIPFLIYGETSDLAFFLLIVPPLLLFSSLYYFIHKIIRMPRDLSLKISLMASVLSTAIIYFEFLSLVFFTGYQEPIIAIFAIQTGIGLIGIAFLYGLVEFIDSKVTNDFDLLLKLDINKYFITFVMASGYIMLLTFALPIGLY